MMTSTRQLMLELTEVETVPQAEAWAVKLETAWEWGLVSKSSYELLKAEFEMHIKYEGIEKLS